MIISSSPEVVNNLENMFAWEINTNENCKESDAE